MGKPVKEKFQEIDGHPFNNEEAENPQGEAAYQELPQPKRRRRKQVDRNSVAPVSFKWPWEWDACLDRYLADRKGTDHRNVQKQEVIIQVLKGFLSRKGYKPASKDS